MCFISDYYRQSEVCQNELGAAWIFGDKRVQAGDYAIIYASAPAKVVLGYGKIKSIILCSPQEMWTNFSTRLGINEQDYLMYYKNSNRSVGIEFEMIKPINPISLAELRRVDPSFQPPQIYRYVTNEEIHKVLIND